MSTSASPPAERLLCDTSFVGHSARRLVKPERYATWPAELLARIEGAILAISVITLAEVRYGYLVAGWGPERIRKEERRLAGLLHVPLDATVLDEWARLRAASKRHGWNVGDNDLWIAATASSRGYALVTCDADQARIADPALEVLHLSVSR